MTVGRPTVYVADDHPSFRDGLMRAVRDHPNLELVGASADGRSALDDIRRLNPSVAVLDFNMPGLTGVEVTGAIRDAGLATRVVMVTASVSAFLVFEVMESGATAVLGKDTRRAEICDAVAAAARGESRLTEDVEALLAEERRFRERLRAARDSLPD